MKVIAVTNRKGGVGKSTISVHIAAGLATRGYRVGLVDTDSQGNAGQMLNIPEEDGLFNALVGYGNKPEPLENVVRLVPISHYSTQDMPAKGALYIIPSYDNTYKIPFMAPPDKPFIFLDMVTAFGERFNLDVIIIDTNPSLNMFDAAVWMAVDGFIYVTECEKLSLTGVAKAVEQLQNFRGERQRIGLDSEVIGLVPNRYRSTTNLHQKNLEEIRQYFGGLAWEPIDLRTIWAEAANSNELVYTYVPSGIEANQAWGMVSQTERMLSEWGISVQEIKS